MDWREWLTVGAYLASALLCLYLFLIVAIVGAVFYFLGKGLRWGNAKTDMLLRKANEYAAIGERYTRKGMDIAAEPEIRGTAAASAAAAFVQRMLRR